MTMFTRTGEGCTAVFQPGEAAALNSLVIEVIALLSSDFDPDDPVVRRLFPDMYRDDPEASAELRQYTEGDLRETKLTQAALVLDLLPAEGGAVHLDQEQSDAWLRTLTDVRLALGLRLGLTDETNLEDELDEAVLRDPMSPRVAHLSVYAYLTYLQESLVGALIG